MAASSVTGKGLGNSKKATTKDLAKLQNGPNIVIAGQFELQNSVTSPPSAAINQVVFPKPLNGLASEYAVILTTLNGGYVYLSSIEESDGKFTGFHAIAEADCTVMYIVVKSGIKPNI